MSITMSEYENYLEACEETKLLLAKESKLVNETWMSEKDRTWNEMMLIRGAAIAMEAVFGIHDYATVDKLGMEDARKRFHKACDREIARAKREREVFA